MQPVISVSESTAKTLKSVFKKPLCNAARLQVRKAYPFPNVENTKCPKLDRVIKQNLSKDVKDADCNAAILQMFNLDAVVPLVFILHGGGSEEHSHLPVMQQQRQLRQHCCSWEMPQPRWQRRGGKRSPRTSIKT